MGAIEVTGVQAEVLTGDDEGWLSFAGATASLPPGLADAGPVLVVDIGGGSTELVVGRVPCRGSRFCGGPVPRHRVCEDQRADRPPRSPLPGELAAGPGSRAGGGACGKSGAAGPGPRQPSHRLAGTVSTLSCLEQGLADDDRARCITRSSSELSSMRWLRVLAAEESRARLAHRGTVAGREEVIVAGILILDVDMAAFDRTRCLVSEDDILDGLVRGLLG